MSTSVRVNIASNFDGGNIESEYEQRPNQHDPSILDVILRIKADVYTELEEMHHMQYFSFASTVVSGIGDEGNNDSVTVRYVIDNASNASYPEAWPGTTVCYTASPDDVDSWKRNLDTFYTQSQLHWEHAHSSRETVYFAYFAGYSRKRHDFLLERCRAAPACLEVLALGQSLQGRDISCVVVGTGPLVAWIIHQQHPGASTVVPAKSII
jgi:hypothetical protein